jgi:hypothetical protein
MSELRKLIDADQDNIKEVERLFANFSSEIHDTIEDTAQMFNALCRAFGQKAKDDPEQDAINDIGKQLGSKNTKELLSILDSSAEIDSQIGKLVRTGRIALDRIWSRRVRGILLIYTQRCFMWAFTDLCRLRITSAFGH